jgi:hypothetical protein
LESLLRDLRAWRELRLLLLLLLAIQQGISRSREVANVQLRDNVFSL